MNFQARSDLALTPGTGVVPPRYLCGRGNEFEIEVASTIEQRVEAWRMAHDVYLRKGYATPQVDGLWYGIHDALPGTTTLVARRGERPMSTLTVIADTVQGLPVDSLFGDVTMAMRVEGRRLSEVVSLACVEMGRKDNVTLVQHMFKLAVLTCRFQNRSTDLVVTVNPRHSDYYEKRMCFDRIADVRSYGKVGGAPAVCLRLNIETFDERMFERFGSEPGTHGHHFCGRESQIECGSFIRENRGLLAAWHLAEFFRVRRPLLQGAAAPLLEYLEQWYPSWAVRGIDPAAAANGSELLLACDSVFTGSAVDIEALSVTEEVCRDTIIRGT